MIRSVDTVALRRFIVRICSFDRTGTLGTGFFVAPGWVVTCAHVVRDFSRIGIIPNPPLNNTPVSAEVVARSGGPVDGQVLGYPDIALLQLQEEINHPCVVLDHSGRPMSEEVCHGFGFPEREHGVDPGGSPATFRFEGVEADGYLRFKEGNAEPGLSGAPLVSPGHGGVVGMMVATRGRSTSLGGYAAPVVPSLVCEGTELASRGQRILSSNAMELRGNPGSWDDVVCVDEPTPIVAEWEAELRATGVYIWTDTDVEFGHAITKNDQSPSPFDGQRAPDVNDLRGGHLPNLQQTFADLGKALDKWLVAAPWNEFGGSIRVLWIVGEQGAHRSKGLLACLARAGWHGYRIYDAFHDLREVAKAVNRPTMPHFARGMIGIDLDDRQASDAWVDVRNAVNRLRTWQVADHDHFPLMIVSGTEEQARQTHQILGSLLEISTVDTKGLPARRVVSHPDVDLPVPSRLTREQYFNRGLPMTTRNLVGRTRELAELRAAWQSEQTRIFTIVASGGTGKSSLINTWLGELQEADFPGAQKVLAWSFYSQGTKDNLVSADPFVEFATSWLGGDSSEKSLNPWERGVQLATLIKRHAFLLVLDGMEPLQYPLTAPDVGGQLTDDSVRALLEELAKSDWRGLCVITTRVPVMDLRPFEKPTVGTVTEWELDNLDEEAGAELLRSLVGGEWEFRKLQPVVRDVGCHALAVTLLGNYLRDVHQGNITCQFDLENLTVDEREGGHARRVMASYVRWLQGHERVAELAVLRVIGLFDRPAFPEAMGALLAEPAMDTLARLGRVGSDEWNRCVGALRGMGLLNREIPAWPGALDAHPLVREHFRDLLRQDPGTWEEGNRRLFEYYRSRAPGLPDEFAGMTHLYSAVNHGCAAGAYEEVFEQVLLKRIWRDRRMNFSTRRLGMTGSDLVALSNFFEHRWTDLRQLPLTHRARTLLMTNAGVRLRQLGRLSDARQCFGSVVREIGPEASDPEEMEDASYAAAQYCELLLIAGRLAEPEAGESESALTSGQSAVAYADRGREPYFKMHARTSLAEVYLMLGQKPQAEALFEQAREIDREDTPRPPFLYSQSLFRYGYFLIETGHADWVLAEAERDQEWGTNGQDSSLLSKAIRSLVLGAARLCLMERADHSTDFVYETKEILDEAVAMFRTAGYADYSVRGLLERARFYRIRHHVEDGDYARALEDLDKAAFEADRGRMDLLRADILLERAACCREFMKVMADPERESLKNLLSRWLDEAVGLIRTMQYARRDGRLKELTD
ncbi:trypsin-like peptidase domain-containing protein [Streptomyces xantholiticus]|uniref:trypsin-like peptidase domain-containing protein n=1 Tax=Streptomyces xantholiticus TaxID=68285 RepID=UPI00167490D7|nr:trypsin-like peptidase domain-containing protein [Streptomyces xantholiticus]GGW55476.1 hypothetical protein GCM10010381_46220 [Streptomyces xantholiticus]